MQDDKLQPIPKCEDMRKEALAGGRLYILQKRSLPRFSLDACLLAAFADLRAQDMVVDLCTGTGIIPLLLYLRENDITVRAVEIMPEMASLAEKSFALNGLNKFSVVCGDIKNCSALLKEKFDLVCCNPPYYPTAKFRRSGDIFKAAAKCEIYCTLTDCVNSAAQILKANGRFAFCVLYERRAEAKELLERYGFSLQEELCVKDNPTSDFWLCLFNAQKIQGKENTNPCKSDILIVYDEMRNYTEQMRDLCRAWLG